MTHQSSQSDELFRLLSELVDDTLTDSEVQRLRDLLRDDPQAQDLYLKYMSVHAQLYLDYGSGSTPIALPGGSSMPLEPPLIAPLGFDPFAGEGLETVPKTGTAPASLPLSPWTLALTFGGGLAAAVLVIGLALVFATRDRRRASDVTQAKAPAGAVVPRPPQRMRGGAIALVVKLDAVRWESVEGPHPSEGEILAEGRLALRSGRLALAFFNGVILTLEGPADLEVVSIDRVFCRRGKIRTYVPAGAEGFVVSAPGSDVVDLGTDLGIDIGSDGKTRVMVFEGKAEAAVLGPSGSSQRNRTVPEHGALEIDPLAFQLDDVEASPESFVAPMGPAIPPLALAPVYRDAVLEARPWGYWRFESIDGGAVANEVAGRPPLRVTGPLRLAGTGNRSVAFESDKTEQYLMMDGRWAPPRDPGYAVELWFATERFSLAELAGLFVPRGGITYDNMLQLELTSRGRESIVFRRASIRFLHRWPAGGAGGDNLFCDYYVPYRWHHVVSQLRNDRMELYVDGKAVPTLSVSPDDRATQACQLIVGQLKPLPRSPGPWENRPFVGQIDELALYDRPLSAEEVRRHYALRTLGGRPSVP